MKSGSGVARHIAVLVATRDRPRILRERAIASIVAQALRPSSVVLVNDGKVWTREDLADLTARLTGIEVLCMGNDRSPGVGGAWNTGIGALRARSYDGFVALLDDDDLWDPSHLQLNFDAAIARKANIVVSGLRIRSAIGDIARPLIGRLCSRDFLVGNPGWQGTNTFVHISLLVAVGGFRESLRSTHDRDLAIRLLRHPEARPCLVPEWTATWCIDLPERLSDCRGEAKLDGLRAFWAIYSSEMNEDEQRAFLDRAKHLFGFSASDIVPPIPPSCRATAKVGDLDVY